MTWLIVWCILLQIGYSTVGLDVHDNDDIDLSENELVVYDPVDSELDFYDVFDDDATTEILPENIYVVGTVDGIIRGIDKNDGTIIWSSNQFGGPLLRSYMAADGEILVPSDKGHVFLSSSHDGIIVHDLTVPDMVKACPFIEKSEKGEIHILGQKTTSMYEIDVMTGRPKLHAAASGNHRSFESHGGSSKTLKLFRTDYIVRAFNMSNDSRELWNVTYSEIQNPKGLEQGNSESNIFGDQNLMVSVVKDALFDGVIFAADSERNLLWTTREIGYTDRDQLSSVMLQRQVYPDGTIQMYARSGKGRHDFQIALPPGSHGAKVHPVTSSGALGFEKLFMPYCPADEVETSNVSVSSNSDVLIIVSALLFALFVIVGYLVWRDRRLNHRSEQSFGDKDVIGSIEVYLDKVLGSGCHGTTVFKGKLSERPVAVKRVLGSQYQLVDKEVDILIKSDGHPNVVRYFTKEMTRDFYYIALELCDTTLAQAVSELKHINSDWKRSISKSSLRNLSIPTATVDFLRDLASAADHLHKLKIIHCDIKPQNILVVRKPDSDSPLGSHTGMGNYFIPKLSDMGLGRKFTTASSNIGRTSSVVGSGTSGWRAPEIVQSHDLKRLDISVSFGRKIDVFSMGCVFFFVLTDGSNPFGDGIEQEVNIMNGNAVNLSMVAKYPEAYDLISKMVAHDPSERPSMNDCILHPFMWSDQMKLDLIKHVSDRLESDRIKSQLEPSDVPVYGRFSTATTECQEKFEKFASEVFCEQGWFQRVDPLIRGMLLDSRRRTYGAHCLRDLIRLIRNLMSHIRDLDDELRQFLTPMPGALVTQFLGPNRFPKLLSVCYKFASMYFYDEVEFSVFHLQQIEIPNATATLIETLTPGTEENAAAPDEQEAATRRYVPPMMRDVKEEDRPQGENIESSNTTFQDEIGEYATNETAADILSNPPEVDSGNQPEGLENSTTNTDTQEVISNTEPKELSTSKETNGAKVGVDRRIPPGFQNQNKKTDDSNIASRWSQLTTSRDTPPRRGINTNSPKRETPTGSTPTPKSAMCRNWETTGDCKFGTKCWFAHGAHELATQHD